MEDIIENNIDNHPNSETEPELNLKKKQKKEHTESENPSTSQSEPLLKRKKLDTPEKIVEGPIGEKDKCEKEIIDEKEEVEKEKGPTHAEVTKDRVLGFSSKYKYGWDVFDDDTKAITLRPYRFVSSNRPVQVGEQVEIHFKTESTSTANIRIYLTNNHPATVANENCEFFHSIVHINEISMKDDKKEIYYKCHINSLGEAISKIDDEDEQTSVPTLDVRIPMWMIIGVVNCTYKSVIAKLNSSRQLISEDKKNDDVQASSSSVEVAESAWTPLRFDLKQKEGWDVSSNGTEAKSYKMKLFNSFRRHKLRWDVHEQSDDEEANSEKDTEDGNMSPQNYLVSSNRPIQVSEEVQVNFKSYGSDLYLLTIYFTNVNPATIIESKSVSEEQSHVRQDLMFTSGARDEGQFSFCMNNLGHIIYKNGKRPVRKSTTTVDVNSPVWMIIEASSSDNEGTIWADFAEPTELRKMVYDEDTLKFSDEEDTPTSHEEFFYLLRDNRYR